MRTGHLYLQKAEGVLQHAQGAQRHLPSLRQVEIALSGFGYRKMSLFSQAQSDLLFLLLLACEYCSLLERHVSWLAC
jgi:hypothetical protein